MECGVSNVHAHLCRTQGLDVSSHLENWYYYLAHLPKTTATSLYQWCHSGVEAAAVTTEIRNIDNMNH